MLFTLPVSEFDVLACKWNFVESSYFVLPL